MAGGFEFDWDSENTNHLAAHKVTPAEFEQVLNNDPLDLDYQVIDGEDRYRSVELRLLRVAWTVRSGKVRAVTAFRASASNKIAFLEQPR